MASTASLLVQIRADTGQATAALRSVNASLKTLEGSAVSAHAKTTSAFGGFKSAITGNVAKAGDQLKQGFTQGIGMSVANSAMNLMGDGLGGVADAAIGMNARLEQSQIAFTVMLHSSTAAKAMLDSLQKLAADTPFEFPDLVSGSQRMLAMGFTAKQVLPMLTSIGDVAAASPMGAKNAMDHITLALGQIQAKGRVQGDEMLQLTEAGVPAWKWLAATLNTDVAGAMAQVTKGTVTADIMMKAFSQGSAKDFGGMMDKQSKTFNGAISTIHDNVTMAIASAFNPLFQVLTKVTVAFAGFTSSSTFAAWAGVLGVVIGGAAVLLGVVLVGAATAATIATARWAATTIVSAAQGAVAMARATAMGVVGFLRWAAAAVAAATATVAAWLVAAGPIVLIIGGIALAAGALALILSGKFGEAKDALGKAFNDIGTAVHAGVEVMQGGFKDGGADAGKALGDGVVSAVPEVTTAAKTLATAAKDAADAEFKKFNEAADKRKVDFEVAHVDAETGALQSKLDANMAEHDTLAIKQQIEDLDRQSIDYNRKRLDLDQQDAITKAKIAESTLKNNADDLSYQQQLLMAQVKAARARGEHVNMHDVRAQMKVLKTAEIEGAPALLQAQHQVSLAERAKGATDLTGALADTSLARSKLALEEANAPMVEAAIIAKRMSDEATYQLDLDKQKFAIDEQAFVLQKLRLEASAKEADLQLWMIEHPVGGTAAGAAPATTVTASLADNRYHPAETALNSPRLGPAEVPGGSSVSTGDVHITVQGGDTSADTLNAIKDSIGSWFQQAVNQVTNRPAPVSSSLGGAGYRD